MGSKTKHTTTSFKDTSICSAQIADSAVTTGKINADAVTSAKISDGTVSASDLASTLDLSSKTLTLPNSSFNSQFYNIGLLGFKMAVNESLTVFNLVDGVVDEFNDESGTDEAEGSNDTYNSTDDYYINSTQPDGQSVNYFAGFGINSVTEPDTSTAGNNPANGTGDLGQYTVPTDITSIDAFLIGAGGGAAGHAGGHGGFVKGTVAVTPGQVINVYVGEGGGGNPYTDYILGGGGQAPGYGAPGGGATMINTGITPGGGPQGLTTQGAYFADPAPAPALTATIMVAGAGGGGSDPTGGHGGGLVGGAGAGGNPAGPAESPTGQVNAQFIGGGGGDQEQGGQGGVGTPQPTVAQSGSQFKGGDAINPNPGGGGGGGGWYGGGAGARGGPINVFYGSGGGGSSYYGHPQVTNGDTVSVLAPDITTFRTFANLPTSSTVPCQAQTDVRPLTNSPSRPTSTGQSGYPGPSPDGFGGDGYVFISAALCASATATTIISNAFTSTSVPTSSRIVVFEENIDTPTLNTDIIASVSRDGGANYTNATLSDSGYVTGSSGQRILTGQADISGQPSGQSMRWKLALANNQVKIHGVSLSWA